jgi:hypothetical protein
MIHVLAHLSDPVNNPPQRARPRSVRLCLAAPEQALCWQHRTPSSRSLPQMSVHPKSHPAIHDPSREELRTEKAR